MTQSQSLALQGDVSFEFRFGIGSDASFYVGDPGIDVSFSFGEDRLPLVDVIEGTAGEVGTSGFVVAGDHRVPATGPIPMGSFANGDGFVVRGSLGNDLTYTVDHVDYDPVTDRTTLLSNKMSKSR